MSARLTDALRETAARTDALLDRFLAYPPDSRAARLYEACRYSSLDGGKRIRPFVAAAFADALGAALPDGFAAAVELIHCASLIHDDLPAMDNDDFRRGKPSNHRKFGEPTAILAGDALLIKAFGLLAEADADAEKRARAAARLSFYAGADGMCGGQQIDLDHTGRAADGDILREQDEKKTGALLAAAAELGTIAGGGTPEQERAAARSGFALGMAFQMVDDLLDLRGSAAAVGKTVGKDASGGKATYPALYGVGETERLAAAYSAQAKEALGAFGEGAVRALLYELTDFLLTRDR